MTDEVINNIIMTRYSNAVNIQASNNDIALDFMALPGFQRDGKIVLEGVRVYMTHEQAHLLANLIETGIQKVNGETRKSERKGEKKEVHGGKP